MQALPLGWIPSAGRKAHDFDWAVCSEWPLVRYRFLVVFYLLYPLLFYLFHGSDHAAKYWFYLFSSSPDCLCVLQGTSFRTVCCCCCCSVSQLNTLRVTRYMHLTAHWQLHSGGWEDCRVTGLYYSTTWAATHRLQRSDLFWRVDAEMQGA